MPPEEMDALIERHYKAVFRAAKALTGDVPRAEDLVQRLWEKVLRLPDWPSADDFLAWARAVMKRDLIDQYRRRVREEAQRSHGGRPGSEGLASTDPWPAVEAGQAIEHAAMQLDVEDLDLLRRFSQGESQIDIAEDLGVDPTTVSKRWARIAVAIRRRLRWEK